jgi:hypothetical protein
VTLFQGILKIVANKDKCDDALPQKTFLSPFRQIFPKKKYLRQNIPFKKNSSRFDKFSSKQNH